MLRNLALVFLSFVLGACADDYSVAVRNTTPFDIEDAYVRFDGFVSVSGSIPPGIYKITHDVGRPVPETATVEWRDSEGRFYKRVVEVRKVVPPGFEREIFFEILPGGNVRVVAREKLPPLPPQSN